MSKFVFDDFALAKLGGAKNISDGSRLSIQQKQDIIAYLKSAQSGPDGVTSYAAYIGAKMQTEPPELIPGVDYLGFSAADRSCVSNFDNAKNYASET
ncbi:MAG: hypothetical protein ACOH1V_06640 [Stenotrophomonas sp.]